MKRATNKKFNKMSLIALVAVVLVLGYIKLFNESFFQNEIFVPVALLLALLCGVSGALGPGTWLNTKLSLARHGKGLLHKDGLYGWQARMTRFFLIREDFD